MVTFTMINLHLAVTCSLVDSDGGVKQLPRQELYEDY